MQIFLYELLFSLSPSHKFQREAKDMSSFYVALIKQIFYTWTIFDHH